MNTTTTTSTQTLGRIDKAAYQILDILEQLNFTTDNQVREGHLHSAITSILRNNFLDEIDFKKELENRLNLINTDDSANKITEYPECPNCGEKKLECDCIKNLCKKCGMPVGNITITFCYDCWHEEYYKFCYDCWHEEYYKL